MKIIALFLFAITSCLSIKAQEVIHAASAEVEINNIQFNYSIGEMVLVDTYSTGDFLLTQGFLQPTESVINSVSSLDAHEDALHVYPNPFTHTIQVSLNSAEDGQFALQLYDASGRVVWSQDLFFVGNNTYQTIDFSMLSAGCYIMKVFSLGNTENNTYISRLIKN